MRKMSTTSSARPCWGRSGLRASPADDLPPVSCKLVVVALLSGAGLVHRREGTGCGSLQRPRHRRRSVAGVGAGRRATPSSADGYKTLTTTRSR